VSVTRATAAKPIPVSSQTIFSIDGTAPMRAIAPMSRESASEDSREKPSFSISQNIMNF
jgi:DNA-binding XRE family transcriptional regulator